MLDRVGPALDGHVAPGGGLAGVDVDHALVAQVQHVTDVVGVGVHLDADQRAVGLQQFGQRGRDGRSRAGRLGGVLEDLHRVVAAAGLRQRQDDLRAAGDGRLLHHEADVAGVALQDVEAAVAGQRDGRVPGRGVQCHRSGFVAGVQRGVVHGAGGEQHLAKLSGAAQVIDTVRRAGAGRQHHALLCVDHQMMGAGSGLCLDAVAFACIAGAHAVVDDIGVVAAARAHQGIAAGQRELGAVADGQRVAPQHAVGVGTALQRALRDQAQLPGGLRHDHRGTGCGAVGVELRLHAGQQRIGTRQAGVQRILAVADLQLSLGIQAGVQRIQIIPARAGVGGGQQLAGIGAFHGDAQRRAGGVHHHAGLDRVDQVLDRAYAFQAHVHAGVAGGGKEQAQRGTVAGLVAALQVAEIGLGGDAGETGGVDDAAIVLHGDGEIVDVGEGRDQRLPAARGEGQAAVGDGQAVGARSDADGVVAGRANDVADVGVADDEGVRAAGAAVDADPPPELGGIDPVAVVPAHHLGGRNVAELRSGDVGGAALDPAVPARAGVAGAQGQPARALAGVGIGLQFGRRRARQAIGHGHQFGAGVQAGAAGDVVDATQQDDLVLAIGAIASLDHAAGHQAAHQHGVAREGRGVDQGGVQAAVQHGVGEHAMQRIAQDRAGAAIGAQAVVHMGGLQARVGQDEVPAAVLGQLVAQGARLGPEVVVPLIAGERVVAQAAAKHVGAGAADQGQVAGVAGAVQRDKGGGVIDAARRRRAVDGAIVLQGHGGHAVQIDPGGRRRARRRVGQHRRGPVARQRRVALDAANVLGGAAVQIAVAVDDVVAAAAADAVDASAVGHGDDVVAQAADDVVAILAARADHVGDVQHAAQAAGVVQGGGLVLVVQVDADVVFVGRVVQRGLARHADENLNVEIADERGRAREAVDAAVARHAGAQVDAHAALRLHAGGDVGAELGEVQCVAALASLLGQGESADAGADDVGVAAAAALDDVLRVADGDGGVAHHGDAVATLGRALHRADRPHVAESGRRRRRHGFAIAAGRGTGQVHRHAGRVAAVVQQGLAVLRGADQVEGLVADLQALAAVGRLEHHVDRALGPVVVGVDRGVADLVAVVVADDGGDVALDRREVQRVVVVAVVLVAHPDPVLLLHALAQFDGRGRGGGTVVEHEGVAAAVGHQLVVGRHADQRGAAGLHAGGGRHHAIPTRHGQRGGLDGAVTVVQHPVAAQRGAADGMRGRGHVGARDGGQAVHEGHAALAGGHVAAVEQDVALFGHRVAPSAQLVLVGIELALAQRRRTERERAGAAVAHDLHGRQVLVLPQDAGDLVDAVIAAVQHDDLGVMAAQHLQLRALARRPGQSAQSFGLAADQAVQPLDHLLGVVDGRIHEDDLAHRRALGLRGVALDGGQGRGLAGRLARQPGLGVALARGVGLGVLIQRNLFAQHALLLEGGALDQVGMRARRAGLLGLRAGLPGLGRHGHGRLLASRRRRRRHQFGRHQVATLQRLEQRPSPEQGLLHLAGGTAGPEFARQFLDAHIATRCSMSPDPFRPRSEMAIPPGWPCLFMPPGRTTGSAG